MILNKAFFGKNNCFKLTVNDKKECYFHFGIEKEGLYVWKKVKMNDAELGDILSVLHHRKQAVSFFHDYNGSSTQIWVNRKNPHFFIKVKELSKSFSEGEQEVLRILIENSIWVMNA